MEHARKSFLVASTMVLLRKTSQSGCDEVQRLTGIDSARLVRYHGCIVMQAAEMSNARVCAWTRISNHGQTFCRRADSCVFRPDSNSRRCPPVTLSVITTTDYGVKPLNYTCHNNARENH